MSKKEAQFSPLALAMQVTKANTVKSRGGSGRLTYLDRIVGVLTNKDGDPVEPMTREEINARVSLQIATERLQETNETLDLTQNEAGEFNTPEHGELFAEINNKVKNQIAAAVSNSQNSTSLSYNESYKDKYEVVKEGKLVYLIRKQ